MAKASIFSKIGGFFKNGKTYTLAALGIVYGLSSAALGHMSWGEALNVVWVNVMAITMRAGINKVPDQVAEEIK